MIVDLGCGRNKRGDVGIDVVSLPGVDHVVNLGFERLPFEDDSVEGFVAYDFLEHVPSIAVVQTSSSNTPSAFVTLRPVIFLLNEIWRCRRTVSSST